MTPFHKSFIHPSSLYYQPNCIYFSTQLTRFSAKKYQRNFALMGFSTSKIFLLLSLTIVMELSSTFGKNLPVSAVSAAPTSSPGSGYQLPSPASAVPPALSPDISPLLPSPGGSGLSPSESSLPIIPSNRSPPNPGPVALPPGPGAAFAPMGVRPESFSLGLRVPGFLGSILVFGLVVLMY